MTEVWSKRLVLPFIFIVKSISFDSGDYLKNVSNIWCFHMWQDNQAEDSLKKEWLVVTSLETWALGKDTLASNSDVYRLLK